jgi:hypothetical protein
VPTETVQLLHPTKSAPRIDLQRYELIRAVIQEALTFAVSGLTYSELLDQLRTLIPQETLKVLGSLEWYTVSVKLDLEARGLIERIPHTRPERVRLANQLALLQTS